MKKYKSVDEYKTFSELRVETIKLSLTSWKKHHQNICYEDLK